MNINPPLFRHKFAREGKKSTLVLMGEVPTLKLEQGKADLKIRVANSDLILDVAGKQISLQMQNDADRDGVDSVLSQDSELGAFVEGNTIVIRPIK